VSDILAQGKVRTVQGITTTIVLQREVETMQSEFEADRAREIERAK
jgi:hypothetical protein